MQELINSFFNAEIIWETLPLLLRAIVVVVEVLVLSLIFAFILGLFLSLLRLSRFRILRALAIAYIDFFRSLPLILLITYIYYGLALAGSGMNLRILILDPVPAGVLALTICYGAYSAEIFRAGIQSIPGGQLEAARSLGMSYSQAMRYVVLPQTFKVVVPPLTNELIAMIKDTALLSVIAVPEILFRSREKMGVVANPSPLTAAAFVYVLFTLPLIRIAVRLEKRYGKGARPVGM